MSDEDQRSPAHLRQPPWEAPLVAPLPEGRFAKNEQWAWARIANGMVADMAFYPGDDADPDGEEWLAGNRSEAPDPKKPNSFEPQHRLSERFLRTILFHEPWASAAEGPGVWVVHARIKEQINWSGRRTQGALVFNQCRFEAAAVLQNLHVRGLLALEGTVLVDALHAPGLNVDGGLYCRNGFVAETDISLVGAHISGNAEFNGAELRGALIADALKVHGDLFCRNSFVAKGDIRLLGAHIGGDADFEGAELSRGLHADRLKIDGNLFCYDGFVAGGDVRLPGTRIGGDAVFDRAELKHELLAHGLMVDGGLYLREMGRLARAELMVARLGYLQLSRSRIDGEIDLTSTIVGRELHLEKGWDTDTLPYWSEGARLTLRNASVGALASRLDAFRRENEQGERTDFIPMDLTGFRYRSLGGAQTEPRQTLAAAPARDLVRWLEAGRGQGAFNPDPYRQLASALTSAGYSQKARRILRAMACHEHKEAKGVRRVRFFFSRLFIDYGFSSVNALGWFAGLVLAFAVWGLNMQGVRAFDFSGAGWSEFFRWLGFSFANAVPLISFDKAHETFLAAQYGDGSDPASTPVWIAWLFYAEKVAGFIILTYLAAGLSGLSRGRVEKE